MGVKLMFGIIWLCACGIGGPAVAQEAGLRLALPEDLIGNGLARHLLPRFRFKARIRVEPVVEGEDADMVISRDGARQGKVVFRIEGGDGFRFAVLTDDPGRAEMALRFLEWLGSGPGRAAIEAFEVDEARLYIPGENEARAVVEVLVDGDSNRGAKLALANCGRCHVVDERNPFGGIGSTPSFGALRGRSDWKENFASFWVFNPHPAFTQIEGVTEAFAPDRPPTIAPLVLTLEETRAITAFVSTLKPKDLGARIPMQ